MLAQIQQLQQQVASQHQEVQKLFDFWLTATESAEHAPVGTAESDRRWQAADDAWDTYESANVVLNELTDLLAYVTEETATSPQVERCGMCDGEFQSIFYYDEKYDFYDWTSYCSKECEKIMGQIDLYEEQQLKLADMRMTQWTYWGEVTI